MREDLSVELRRASPHGFTSPARVMKPQPEVALLHCTASKSWKDEESGVKAAECPLPQAHLAAVPT